VARKYGVSRPTLYEWNAKYGGLDVSQARRLKALEDESVKLKKLLADAMLDNAMLKDIAAKKVTPAARRKTAAHLRVVFAVSERRAWLRFVLTGPGRTRPLHPCSRRMIALACRSICSIQKRGRTANDRKQSSCRRF
jgi:hypothetical protein